jgi:hypothetical protein
MRSLLAGFLVVLALVGAGCGGSSSPTTTKNGTDLASKPATQVVAASVKAADAASSLHMSGTVSTKGKPIGIDMSIAKDNGATGSITLNGHKVELVIIGSNGYMKGDGAFWSQFGGSAGATIAQLLQGKWLKFPVNNAQFRPIIAFSSAKALFAQLKSGADSHLQNKGTTTYKGQSVIAIDDGTQNGTFYVAATGTPYPVALVKTGSSSGAIAFSDWNQPVSLTAPTNVLDFSHLGR